MVLWTLAIGATLNHKVPIMVLERGSNYSSKETKIQKLILDPVNNWRALLLRLHIKAPF